MNKARLFLFSIISFSIFSCSAMDLAFIPDKLGTFFTHKDIQPFQVDYRKAVDNFNKNTDDLKKILENPEQQSFLSTGNPFTYRRRMVENLEEIKTGIQKIVRIVQDNNQISKEQSLRIEFIDSIINDIGTKSNSNILDTLEKDQILVNKIANFTINEDLRASTWNDSLTCLDDWGIASQHILQSNQALLYLFNQKQEQKNEQLRQNEEYNLKLEQEKKEQLRKEVEGRLTPEQREKRKAHLAQYPAWISLNTEECNTQAERQETAKLALMQEEELLFQETTEVKLAREKREREEKEVAARLAAIEETAKLALIEQEAMQALIQKENEKKLGEEKLEEMLKEHELRVKTTLKEAYEKFENDKKIDSDTKEPAQAKINNNNTKNKVKMAYIVTGTAVAGIIAYIIYLYKNNQLETSFSHLTHLINSMLKNKSFGSIAA